MSTYHFHIKKYYKEQVKAVQIFDIARGSTTVTCILVETQRQVEKWDSFILEKRWSNEKPKPGYFMVYVFSFL